MGHSFCNLWRGVLAWGWCVASKLKIINLLSVKMMCKKKRGRNSHMCLQWLLLLIVKEGERLGIVSVGR